MQAYLKEIARGKRGAVDLSYDQTREAANDIISGSATDAQIAAFFIAERIKTESPEELLAFIDQFRLHTTKLEIDDETQKRIIDFAGPYTGRKTFCATIPAAILFAERKIPVFLHSSKSLPPKYGAAIKQILETLGIPVHLEKPELQHYLQEKHFGFADTEAFCQPLANLRPIREQLGVRTLLNTAEKMLNIAQAPHMMMGAFHRTAINKITPIFGDLPYKQAFIVQGVEGSEDMPVHRNSFVFKVEDGTVEDFIVKPDDYHLRQDEKWYRSDFTLEDQCDVIGRVLRNDSSESISYFRSQTIFNTGVRYYLFGYEPSIEEGIAYAEKQIQEQAGFLYLQDVLKAY